MGNSDCLERGGAIDATMGADWLVLAADKTYECRVLLIPEETGGFSALALRLPGVASQGDTEVEALDNIRDAFQAAIQSYRECSQEIPWKEVEADRPSGSFERWILVDA